MTLFYLLNYQPTQVNIKDEISERVLKSAKCQWRSFYGFASKDGDSGKCFLPVNCWPVSIGKTGQSGFL